MKINNAIEAVIGKKKSKWNDKHKEAADSLYSLINSEVLLRSREKGSSLNAAEFDQMLSDLTRKVTIERSLFGVDFLYPDAEQSVTDIPRDELRELSKYLRNNGIPVTNANLTKAYRQASE